MSIKFKFPFAALWLIMKGMVDLDPLIRVRRHIVEQKQKFLAELYRQAEEMEAQKSNLLRTLEEEKAKISEMGVEMLKYFGPYSDAVKDRVEEIEDALMKLNARIEVARDDMRNAFSELKKIEITQERREEEEQARQDKKEDLELDEIALETFRRKQEE